MVRVLSIESISSNKKGVLIAAGVIALVTLVASASWQKLYANQPAPANPKKVFQKDFANTWTTWTYHDDTVNPLVAANPNPTADHEIVQNPDPSPSDKGAVRLVAEQGEKWNLASLQYSGTKLADITGLGFDVYTDKPGQAYANLDVNFNSWTATHWNAPVTPFYHGRLVYVPDVAANTWESEEAVASNGTWSWSLFYKNGGEWPDGSTDVNRSWDDIVASFPNAHISHVTFQFAVGKPFGSLYLRADGDAGTTTTYYDHVYLRTDAKNKVYNFETPHALPH